MSRPVIADLFCGAGGAAMGLFYAGFRVVGFDVKPQPNYPFEFHRADAMTVDLSQFDAVWASPPCQAYSALKTMPNAGNYPKLVSEVRKICERSGVPFIIENVPGAPLQNPITLCGSMFGLRSSDGRGLRRHRLFEVHPPLFNLLPPCGHPKRTIGIYGEKARDIALEKRHYAQPKETRGEPEGVVLEWSLAEEAMGIYWMNRPELCEAIPPAYSHYLGEQLIKYVKVSL